MISEEKVIKGLKKGVFPPPSYMNFISRFAGAFFTLQNPLRILSTSRFRGRRLYLHVKCVFPVKSAALRTLKIDTITCSSVHKGFSILASRIIIYRRKIDVEFESPDSHIIVCVEFNPEDFGQVDERIEIKFSFEIFNRPYFIVHEQVISNQSSLNIFNNFFNIGIIAEKRSKFISHQREMIKLKSFKNNCKKKKYIRQQNDNKYILYYHQLKKNRNDLIGSGRQLIVFYENFEKFQFHFPSFDIHNEGSLKRIEDSLKFFIYLSGITNKPSNQINHVFKSGLFSHILSIHKHIHNSSSTEKLNKKLYFNKEVKNPKILKINIEYILMLSFNSRCSIAGKLSFKDLIEKESSTIFDIMMSSMKRGISRITRKNKEEEEKEEEENIDSWRFDDSNLINGMSIVKKYKVLRQRFFSHPIKNYFFKILKTYVLNLFKMNNDGTVSTSSQNRNVFKKYNMKMIYMKLLKSMIVVICRMINSDGGLWKSRIQACKKMFLTLYPTRRKILGKLIIGSRKRKLQHTELLTANLLQFPDEETVTEYIHMIAFAHGFNKYFYFLKKKKGNDDDVNNMIIKCRVINHQFFSERVIYRLIMVMDSYKTKEKLISCICCILTSLMEPFIYNDIEFNNKQEEEVKDDDYFEITPKDKIDKFDRIFRAIQKIDEYGGELDRCLCIVHFLQIFKNRRPVKKVINRMKSLLDMTNEMKILESYMDYVEQIIKKSDISNIQSSYNKFINIYFEKIKKEEEQKEEHKEEEEEEKKENRKRKRDMIIKKKKKEVEEKRRIQVFNSFRDIIIIGSLLIFPSWMVCDDSNYKKVFLSRVDDNIQQINDEFLYIWRNHLKDSKRIIPSLPIFYEYFMSSVDYNQEQEIETRMNLHHLYMKEFVKLTSQKNNFF